MKSKTAFSVLLLGSLMLTGCWHDTTTGTVTVTGGKDFIGVWQITEICLLPPQNKPHFDDHSTTGQHVKKDGWYAIYPKGMSGGETVFGMLITKGFADHVAYPMLKNWTNMEFHYEKKANPTHKGNPCQLPGNVSLLKTVPATEKELHVDSKHPVQIWLYEDNAGKIRPVISFDHETGSLHKGMVH